jgi:adenylosuccinate lyase
MDSRYIDPAIQAIFDPEKRLIIFDKVEVAGVEAKEKIIEMAVPEGTARLMREWMQANPPDEKRRKEIEAQLDHDFLAYVRERVERMPENLGKWMQAGFTTFDIQDPADQIIYGKALGVIDQKLGRFAEVVRGRSLNDFKWILMFKSHGQSGQPGSLGKREAGWYARLELARAYLRLAMFFGRFAKASGAMGNYGNTIPEIENKMMGILGLWPFIGAQQILPRGIHGFEAFALMYICTILAEISADIWLMSRDPYPLVREPKGKQSAGSSAMPHKKNPIKSENTLGMLNIAAGDTLTTLLNMFNVEERIIHHSSGERVSFKDLFHTTANALNTMEKVLRGLRIYPRNMMRQIIASKKTYGSEAAKEFLISHGQSYGFGARNDIYDLVKLAAVVVLEDDLIEDHQLGEIVNAKQTAEIVLSALQEDLAQGDDLIDLEIIIRNASLRTSPTLDISQETVDRWNQALREMFSNQEIARQWPACFDLAIALEGEKFIEKRLWNGSLNLRIPSIDELAKLFLVPSE